MLLLIGKISPTSPAHWTSLGRIWGFWLSLKLEGVEATSSIQWPWAANNGHTHAYCYALAPCCTPSPFSPPLMDCFPHSPCLACAVASQHSRQPLGTALFSLSPTPNLQTVSDFTHELPSFLDFQPYWVSCFVFTTADETGLWGLDVAFESASTQWRKKKYNLMLVLVVPIKDMKEKADPCNKMGIE